MVLSMALTERDRVDLFNWKTLSNWPNSEVDMQLKAPGKSSTFRPMPDSKIGDYVNHIPS